ncbi:ATPase [Listeria sp. FSL L7-1582]|uniref:SRPBCC domain-containing protein n=1 Tax=Listeria portnoyi TaxID=2713504 RepID=UPI00164E9770|nr:SRPBCC domain-containing protein [Listeria portnoyi]MBC6308023.1 ATPase [Listeria portnoyi]
MQEKYQKITDTSGIMTFELELDSKIAKVWELIATTKGFAQWFPELSVGESGVDGLILFDFGNGEYEEMTITVYEPKSILEYTWDKNMVRFELTDHGEKTTLRFTEEINELTTHTPRDISGWHMCLQKIQGILEDKDVSFTEDEFLALFDKYQALMN